MRAPVLPVDVLVALNAETIELDLNDMVSGGVLLYDAKSINVAPQREDIPLCDATPHTTSNRIAPSQSGC